LLAQAPAWLPVFIGVCVAIITFFIAIAVYYSAIDAKFASNFQPGNKVASLFSVVAAAGLGVYFYHRLLVVLTTVVGAGWIVSAISAVAVVLMFVNFFLSIQDKLTGDSIEYVSNAFVDSSDLNDCNDVVGNCQSFLRSEDFLEKFNLNLSTIAE
jgi:CDP-diglyceride synthetase